MERRKSQERLREEEGNFRPQINNTSREASRERANNEEKAGHNNVGERLYFEGLKSIINKKLKTVEGAQAEQSGYRPTLNPASLAMAEDIPRRPLHERKESPGFREDEVPGKQTKTLNP